MSMKSRILITTVTTIVALGSWGVFFTPKANAQLEAIGSAVGGAVNNLLGSVLGESEFGVQTVRIISDASESAVTTAIKSTLSALAGEQMSDALSQLLFKEQVLDPAAWGIAKQMQQQLTSELLKWLGGQQPGQNGEVPFVQNYSNHYQNIADQVAAQFIYNEKAGAAGQCEVSSPEKEEEVHRVVTALGNSYASDRQKALYGGALQCEKEEAKSSYKNTVSRLLGDALECRDETCAYFAARKEQADRTDWQIKIEGENLQISGGMKAKKICSTVAGPNGVPRPECLITSPLSLMNDIISFNLAEIPGLQMLNMDEFNEISSNLMSNLTNQALQGLTGVLGLSGNPNYSQNIFGADGSLSYADAIARDSVTQYQVGGTSPVKAQLAIEQQYAGLQTGILSEISNLESKLDSNFNEFPTCFDLELTNELKKIKEDAVINFNIASTTITILTVLDQQYDGSTDANVRNSVVTTFAQYRNQGIFHTTLQNQDLKISFIDISFAKMVDKFKYDTATERQRCGGSFDYSGVLTST